MNKVKGITKEPTVWQYNIGDLIDDYTEHLKVANRSPKTIKGYLESITYYARFLKENNIDKPVAELGEDELRKYVLYLRGKERWDGSQLINRGGKLSPYTIFTYVRDIKVFWSWLTKYHYIEINPLVEFPLPKVPKLIIPILSYEQIRKLLNVIDRHSSRGVMRYCIVVLLLDTGIRVSELTNIRIGDLDFNHKMIKVMGKGQKERVVPISASTRKELVNYIDSYRSSICGTDSPWLFPNDAGEPLTVNTVQQFLRRLAVRSGITNVRCSPHVFRHTFATLAVSNEANIETLRVIMGHQSIVTTTKYTHISARDLQKQHSQFSPINALFGKAVV